MVSHPSRRSVAAVVEAVESRVHLSATAAVGPAVDEGDWTAGHVGRIATATSFADDRPVDRYTFAVTAPTRVSASLTATGMAGGDRAVRLVDAGGSAALSRSRLSVGGLVRAGTYTLVVAATDTFGYVLAVRATPAGTAGPAARTAFQTRGATSITGGIAPDLATAVGPFHGGGRQTTGQYAGTAAGAAASYYALGLDGSDGDGSDGDEERVTVTLRSPDPERLRVTVDGEDPIGNGSPTRRTFLESSAKRALTVSVDNANDPGDPIPYAWQVSAAEIRPRPAPRGSGGGSYYFDFGGGTDSTATAGPDAIPPNLDLSAVLTGAARGWTFAATGDRWTFAAGGTGVRSIAGTAVPFTWVASPGRLTVTYGDGSTEQATATDPEHAYVSEPFEMERNGVFVGDLGQL